jgi:hypothetical protein
VGNGILRASFKGTLLQKFLSQVFFYHRAASPGPNRQASKRFQTLSNIHIINGVFGVFITGNQLASLSLGNLLKQE